MMRQEDGSLKGCYNTCGHRGCAWPGAALAPDKDSTAPTMAGFGVEMALLEGYADQLERTLAKFLDELEGTTQKACQNASPTEK